MITIFLNKVFFIASKLIILPETIKLIFLIAGLFCKKENTTPKHDETQTKQYSFNLFSHDGVNEWNNFFCFSQIFSQKLFLNNWNFFLDFIH